MSSDVVKPTKAVFVAAGMGQRLRPFTDEMPKCLVPIAGKPMLVRSMGALRNVSVGEFTIVRGYLAEVLEKRKEELGTGIRFVENSDYESNNILQSLFKAEKYLQGPVYVSYSDIIFTQGVCDKLAYAEGDICLIVDTQYSKIYEGRTLHPLEQAELCELDQEGFVIRVGKCSCSYEKAYGEFIGLAKFSEKGIKCLVDTYNELKKEYEGTTSKPFVRAKNWSQAYLCDLLEFVAQNKPSVKIVAVPIEGCWREIDTTQDKERADRTWSMVE